jgi:hypothetical protein
MCTRVKLKRKITSTPIQKANRQFVTWLTVQAEKASSEKVEVEQQQEDEDL